MPLKCGAGDFLSSNPLDREKDKFNVSILAELKIVNRLSSLCLKRVLQFFGHIARKEDNSLEKLIVVGRIEGSRGRGRYPTRWTDQVKTATGTSVVGAMRTAMCRERWRETIRSVLRTVREDGHDPQQ